MSTLPINPLNTYRPLQTRTLRFGTVASKPKVPNNRFLLVSDVYQPTVSGVVTTLMSVEKTLRKEGYEVDTIKPTEYPQIPSVYKGLNVSIPTRIKERIRQFKPNRIAIFTPEAPLGMTVRNFCVQNKLPFITFYTTRFPEYFNQQFKIPKRFTYAIYRYIHKHSKAVFVNGQSMFDELQRRGFKNLVLGSRGIDSDRYKILSAKEKEAFLKTQRLSDYVPHLSEQQKIGPWRICLSRSTCMWGDYPRIKTWMSFSI